MIYHGTNTKCLSSISKNGIVPRGNKKSVWKNYPSRKDMIYLTNTYALHFAKAAADNYKNSNPVIIEIDFARLYDINKFPDEDFIAQVIAQQQKKEISSIHDKIKDNIFSYQQNWKLSLDKLGNIAYRGIIPISTIKRYAIIDYKKQIQLLMDCDPVISLMNHLICSNYYQQQTRWIFDGGEYPQFFGTEIINKFPKVIRETHFKEKQMNRDGIEVKVL